ncbi:MAG: ArsC family (seleno)protein [Planctomycetaceae bacterium]
MANKQIDWYYHRVGCTTCRRADEFLEKAKVSVAERINARKDRIGPKEALKLVRTARHLFVAKGKKVVQFDLGKDAPGDAELKKLVIGPSGNLRAPTLRVGDRMFIGFNAEQIQPSLFGS